MKQIICWLLILDCVLPQSEFARQLGGGAGLLLRDLHSSPAPDFTEEILLAGQTRELRAAKEEFLRMQQESKVRKY